MATTKNIEQLFRTNYVAMHRLAMLILRDDDAARDIVHDVFESLLNAGLTDVSGHYLLKAVRNRSITHIRSLSAKERFKEIYVLDEEEIAADEWPDDETLSLIQAVVANDLSDACRRVVTLRFTAGMSYKEISGSLGISEVAVYKHLRHAIDVLRLKLTKNG